MCSDDNGCMNGVDTMISIEIKINIGH